MATHPSPEASGAAEGLAVASSAEIKPATIIAMAVTAALTAANLYYNQPLLVQLQHTFDASTRAVGSIPTLTQVGYALGMLLLVPLGDMVERRRLILISLVAVCGALCLAAVAPTLAALAAASLLIGLGTMVPQLIIPFAAQLAPSGQRGRVLGIVTGGLVTGILLARTISGWVGTVFGWRAMYGVAACLMLLLTFVVYRWVPLGEPVFKGRYGALLRSVWTLLREEPVLRESAALGACLFGSFSAFWGTLTFMLAEPPYSYGPAEVGVFGLVGAAGAVGASAAGRLADRMDKRRMLCMVVVILIVAWALMWVFRTSLIGLVAGVLLLDAAVQGGQVTNQARIFALREDARSRLNTAYMFCYFAGGATGTYAAVALWSVAGWPGVCASNITVLILCLLWLRHNRD